MRLQLPGLVMGYDEKGSGPPLLLLHGFPLTRRLWRKQLELLQDTARVIAPDLRGFGETEATPGPYSMDLLASDCFTLLDQLGVDGPVVVGGLSLGGYLALAFFRRYPERVAGLILAATRAGADGPEARANRDRNIALAQEKGAQAVAEGMLPRLLAPRSYEALPDVVDEARDIMRGASDTGVVGALQGMKDRPDSTDLLPNIDRPVLILHGSEDQIIPPAEAEAMHGRLRRSYLKLIPDAGHLPNLEQPITFSAEMRTFLKSLL